VGLFSWEQGTTFAPSPLAAFWFAEETRPKHVCGQLTGRSLLLTLHSSNELPTLITSPYGEGFVLRKAVTVCGYILAVFLAGPALADAPKRVVSSDWQISQAWAAARATLPTALGATEKRYGWFSPSLALKVALPVENPDVQAEMIWVDRIRRNGTMFEARLAGYPHHMPAMRMGDTVDFFYDQIADWAVQAVDGRFYGYYTTRVLIKSMDPERAAKYQATLVDNPLPPGWRFNPEK